MPSVFSGSNTDPTLSADRNDADDASNAHAAHDANDANDANDAKAALAAWLQLEYTANLPLDAVRAWLSVLGSAHAVVSATQSQLAKIVTEAAASAVKTPLPDVRDKRQAYIDSALTWVTAPGYDGTRHILTWDHADYPAQLLTISDPPLVLFVQGNAAALSRPAVGIVGARNATQQGVANARVFAQSLADKNITVISGMALGIDAAAHEGALNALHNPCATVAVVGTGIDRVYPASHRDLAHRIAAQGAVVSEFPIGTPPMAHNFPRRNRLIAGLSRGVLVVEAALRSGSLITARVAGEQGREVLAIPGSIHAPLSKGCHQLLKQGAKLVESAQDVMEELRLDQSFDLPSISTAKAIKASSAASAFANSSVANSAVKRHTATAYSPSLATTFPGSDDPVLAAMGHTPMDLDQLVAATQMATGDLLSRLTELELFGQVEALDGARYQRLVV
jgi:DNA processing protein